MQDFVQATEDEDTPKEWLHRIMETSSRESSDYDINLLGVEQNEWNHTLDNFFVQGSLTPWIVTHSSYLLLENICFKTYPG